MLIARAYDLHMKRQGSGINTSAEFMLVDPDEPSARSAVHLIFIGEKVRPDDLAEIPASDPVRTKEGIWICPVADLVRVKLTRYLLKDKVHLQDLDGVGLITPEIE